MPDILKAISEAVTGKPTPTDPTEKAASVICVLALPSVKEKLGAKFDTAKKLHLKQRRFAQINNFELTEKAANEAYNTQQAELQKKAGAGDDLAKHPRGRSRTAWIEDFKHRKLASEDAAKANWKQLEPLLNEIGDALHTYLLEQAVAVELASGKEFQKFGLAYIEAPLSQKLRSLAPYMRARGTRQILDL